MKISILLYFNEKIKTKERDINGSSATILKILLILKTEPVYIDIQFLWNTIT